MSKSILVIGSLFVTPEHEQRIVDAGYAVERIAEANPTEEQLIKSIKGKVAVINGGIAQITDAVFEAADVLKVVSFTGADWKAAMPGYKTAERKGIAISNAPGGNAGAVAEYSLAMALMMQRRLREIGGDGELDYLTSKTLNDSNIGVIGAGHIGSKIIRSVLTFDPASVSYVATAAKPELEQIGARLSDLDALFSTSDVIFVAAPGSMGQIFDEQGIAKIKDGALVVHVCPQAMIDYDALLGRLQKGTLRFALDWPAPTPEFADLPPEIWYSTNSHLAYNTTAVVQKCSDMAVDALLDMLEGKESVNKVV